VGPLLASGWTESQPEIGDPEPVASWDRAPMERGLPELNAALQIVGFHRPSQYRP